MAGWRQRTHSAAFSAFSGAAFGSVRGWAGARHAAPQPAWRGAGGAWHPPRPHAGRPPIEWQLVLLFEMLHGCMAPGGVRRRPGAGAAGWGVSHARLPGTPLCTGAPHAAPDGAVPSPLLPAAAASGKHVLGLRLLLPCRPPRGAVAPGAESDPRSPAARHAPPASSTRHRHRASPSPSFAALLALPSR